MSFIAVSFDTAHNLAHVIKDAGYFVNIIALALSSIHYTKNLKKSNALIRNQYIKVKEAKALCPELGNSHKSSVRKACHVTHAGVLIVPAKRFIPSIDGLDHRSVRRIQADFTGCIVAAYKHAVCKACIYRPGHSETESR